MYSTRGKSSACLVGVWVCAHVSAALGQPVCVNHFGLTHCAEGQTFLTVGDLDGDGDLELLISNIGSSGQDGVLYKKGDDDWIRELSIGFNDPLIGAPDAAYIKFDGVDSDPAGGPPAQVIFGLQATRVAGEVVLSWAHEPIGVTSYTINVYDAGILMASVASSGPPTVTAPEPPQVFKWDSGTLPPEVTARFNFFEAWPASIQDSNGNVTTVTGDEVEMIAHEGADPGSLDAMRITGAGVSSITIDGESVVMADGSAVIYGLDNAPRGQATLQSNNDCDGELDHASSPRLHVCNIGSSGDDGVAMAGPFGGTDFYWNWLDPEDPPGTLAVNAYLSLTPRGFMPGAPAEQPLGSWRVTKIAPGPGQLPYELSVDFSPLGVTSYDLEVLDADTGAALFSETDRTNPIIGTQDHWPVAGGGAVTQGNIILVARNDSELRILGGPTVASAGGLDIRMIAHPSGAPPERLSGMELKAADIPSLAITDEQAEVIGSPIPAVSTWGMIVMSLLALTTGILVHARRCTKSQAA